MASVDITGGRLPQYEIEALRELVRQRSQPDHEQPVNADTTLDQVRKAEDALCSSV